MSGPLVTADVRAAKRAVRDKKKSEREWQRIERIRTARLINESPVADAQREQKARERACFWTWPFGHRWGGWETTKPTNGQPTWSNVCMVCGKRQAFC